MYNRALAFLAEEFSDFSNVVMMTSSNGNIFRVTGLCVGTSPVTGEFSSQRPVTRSFDVFFDLVSKEPRRR